MTYLMCVGGCRCWETGINSHKEQIAPLHNAENWERADFLSEITPLTKEQESLCACGNFHCSPLDLCLFIVFKGRINEQMRLLLI